MEEKPEVEETWLPLGGYLLPLLTLICGFGVYFVVFEFLVDPLNPGGNALGDAGLSFLWESDAVPATILAADLDARYAFAVPSVLMTLAFIAALVVGFFFVLPYFGRVAVVLGLLALPAGAAIGLVEQHANPLRAVVADCPPGIADPTCPLDVAVARAPAGHWFDAGVLDQVRLLAQHNSMISVAAIMLIGICVMFIARTVPDDRLTVGALVRRRVGLDTMLTLIGPVLVFSVATTHGFYHFSSSLLIDEQAEAYRHLASAGTTYWGAVYTTVILVIAVPASLSVARDGRRLAARVLPGGTFAERLAWRKDNGVELSIRDRLSLITAGFAPVLTTPLLDLLQKSFGG